ncbi:MAG: hypothetical protein ACP5LN_08960, partial [Thermoproteota archaeon]
MSHAILPEKFLDWAYFGRVRFLKSLLEGGNTSGMKFLIESTRHTPALATARIENGKLFLNAKVVGSGFVLKREFMEQAIIELKIHVESGRSIPSAEYNKRGIQLLLKLLYFENKEEAYQKLDFTKITTLEIGATIKGSSKHTWTNVQKSKEAVLLYYMPPSLSFEVRGKIEVHTSGVYYEFVNLVHDSFHYSSSSRKHKPCYVINVEEVYDNSATNEGF